MVESNRVEFNDNFESEVVGFLIIMKEEKYT